MKKRATKTKSAVLHSLALLALLALPVLLSSCSSNDHMYRHKRSDCDCPRFD